MSAALTLSESLSPALLALLERTRGYVENAKSESTKRAYGADWRDFGDWCAAVGRVALPADAVTVALYVTHLADAGRKPSTISRRLTAIAQAHAAACQANPCGEAAVRETNKGVRRTHGTAQKKAPPVLVEDLRAMVAALDLSTLLGLRDRALLLVGFAAALRRSELVALDIEGLEWRQREGMVLTLRQSKTDQEAQGRRVGVAYGSHLCPVRALREWLEAAGITAGPVFRGVNRHGQVAAEGLNDKTVDRVVKRCADAAGLRGDFSAHSLRAGLATQAARMGQSELTIARQTGHKSLPVLRGYIREGDLFVNNVTAALGL